MVPSSHLYFSKATDLNVLCLKPMDQFMRILPNYTYDDYVHWKGRWEVMDGIAFSNKPTPRHQLVAGGLSSTFFQEKKATNADYDIYLPIDLRINNNTIVNPDLLIVREPISKKYLDFPPIFVAEVVSKSTRLKDYYTKKWLYKEFGIKYYLIADLEDHSLTLWQLNSKKEYQETPIEAGLVFSNNYHVFPEWSTVYEDLI